MVLTEFQPSKALVLVNGSSTWLLALAFGVLTRLFSHAPENMTQPWLSRFLERQIILWYVLSRLTQ
jgi:hypothetical protein